jgi:iron complex transport system substrate-binding protein
VKRLWQQRLGLGVGLCLLALPGLSPAFSVMDADGRSVEIRDASRIVAVGGAVTETLFALGESARLVGVDSTSQWPEAARRLPQVGYQRTLAAEGILALKPTLLIGTQQAGPPPVLDKLRAAGVTVLILPVGPDVDSALQSLQTLAAAVGKAEAGHVLAQDIRARLAALAAERGLPAPATLFILSASGGTPLAAGRDSNADTLIRLAGGRNAITQYAGYRPLSAEAVSQLAPEAIVVPEHVVHELGGRERVLALPGIAQTPAARSRRLVVMDGVLLLGMGPRLAEAAEQLARSLHRDVRARR